MDNISSDGSAFDRGKTASTNLKIMMTCTLINSRCFFVCHSCFPCLFSQVKEHGHSQKMKTKASGLLKKLTSRRMVEFGHFLWDVVITMSQLSLSLQKRDCCAAEVSDHMHVATVLLQKYAVE